MAGAVIFATTATFAARSSCPHAATITFFFFDDFTNNSPEKDLPGGAIMSGTGVGDYRYETVVPHALQLDAAIVAEDVAAFVYVAGIDVSLVLDVDPRGGKKAGFVATGLAFAVHSHRGLELILHE